MAVTSRVVCFQPASAISRSRRSRGSKASSAARNTTPSSIPPAAGTQPGISHADACSMAGSSRLHTAAAVITPAANPSITLCTRSFGVPRKKKTVAAPSVVMAKVNPVPAAAHESACIIIIIPFAASPGGLPGKVGSVRVTPDKVRHKGTKRPAFPPRAECRPYASISGPPDRGDRACNPGKTVLF